MAKVVKRGPELSLPTKPSTPVADLGGYSILLYGREKVGKTTLAGCFDDAFFLMCEPGGKALRIHQRPVKNWKEFLGYVKLLEENPDQFKTIVVDTVDLAFKYCDEYICQKLAIGHVSEEDWGKGYAMVKSEFQKVMARLQGIGRGVIFTSHVVEKEIKRRGGKNIDMIIPSMPKQAREVLEPMVDMFFYIDYTEEGGRTLHLRGDDVIAAGHRLKERFVGMGEIDLGNSPEDGYNAFINAFNNEGGAKPVPKKAQGASSKLAAIAAAKKNKAAKLKS